MSETLLKIAAAGRLPLLTGGLTKCALINPKSAAGAASSLRGFGSGVGNWLEGAGSVLGEIPGGIRRFFSADPRVVDPGRWAGIERTMGPSRAGQFLEGESIKDLLAKGRWSPGARRSAREMGRWDELMRGQRRNRVIGTGVGAAGLYGGYQALKPDTFMESLGF